MKTVIPLGLAIILGLVAAILVRNTIAHRGVTTSSNTVAVVVAKLDVEPGSELTKEDLSVAKVPAEIAPGHVFSDPNQLVGRVVTTPLSVGQTIMESLLAPTGTGSGLQALIPPGMRAVTMEINEFSGVAGMIEPGSRVDLICTIMDPKVHESFAKTILQNVKISAIGRNMSPPHPVEGQPLPPTSNNVTLLLTPKQVQVLQLAQMSSRPWLVLRSSRDNNMQQIEPTPLAFLRGDPGEGEDGQVQNTVAPGPTTPANPFQPVDVVTEPQPTTIKRNVIFIRGGVETQHTITIPAPPHTETVGTNNDLKPVDGGN